MHDTRTQASVERKFITIGEALNRIHGVDPELSKRFPEFQRIVGFRNMLAHGYDRMKSDLVWDYTQNELSDLHGFVQDLLSELKSLKTEQLLFLMTGW